MLQVIKIILYNEDGPENTEPVGIVRVPLKSTQREIFMTIQSWLKKNKPERVFKDEEISLFSNEKPIARQTQDTKLFEINGTNGEKKTIIGKLAAPKVEEQNGGKFFYSRF